jgi:excisionase family DNA binding protein
MSAAVKTPLQQRYGSAAEVSALTGLSVKTVRRRVKDGSLRGVRLGRRVLIPLDAIDRPRTQESPVMATAPTPDRPGAVDPATGRLRPLTDRERRARSEALGRALDAIAGMTDETDTDEVWRDVLRGIDEGRPHRPLFEGSY